MSPFSLNPNDVPDDVLENQQYRLSERQWIEPRKRVPPPSAETILPAVKDTNRLRLRNAGLEDQALAFIEECKHALILGGGYTEARAFEEAWLVMWAVFLPAVARYEAGYAEQQRRKELFDRQIQHTLERLPEEFQKLRTMGDSIRKEAHEDRDMVLRELREEKRCFEEQSKRIELALEENSRTAQRLREMGFQIGTELRADMRSLKADAAAELRARIPQQIERAFKARQAKQAKIKDEEPPPETEQSKPEPPPLNEARRHLIEAGLIPPDPNYPDVVPLPSDSQQPQQPLGQ